MDFFKTWGSVRSSPSKAKKRKETSMAITRFSCSCHLDLVFSQEYFVGWISSGWEDLPPRLQTPLIDKCQLDRKMNKAMKKTEP